MRSDKIPVPRMKGLNHSAELVSDSTLAMILFSFSSADSSRYSGLFTLFTGSSHTHVDESFPQLPNKPSLLLQACEEAKRRVAMNKLNPVIMGILIQLQNLWIMFCLNDFGVNMQQVETV